MATVLAIVLFVVAVLAYALGVRKQAAWGKPVLVICVVALVLVVLDRTSFHVLSGRRGGGGGRETARERQAIEEPARLLGEAIKPSLPDGGRVLLVARGGSGSAESIRGWQAGLSQGLGTGNWQVERFMCSPQWTAETLSRELGAKGQYDAIVSFSGLPEGAEQMSIFESASPPKVGAYFSTADQIETIRLMLENGLLVAAVVRTQEGFKVYTPDNLP